MGWQYSSAGLSAGSQAAPLVGPDGASTSSASNIGNQRDATGPRCRVGRSQVHRGISEIDGRPNLGPFCREPKMAPGQVCPVAGRRSAVATPRSRLPVCCPRSKQIDDSPKNHSAERQHPAEDQPILRPKPIGWNSRQGQRGDEVQVTVENALDTVTTVHWHGLLAPGYNDGGPQQLIKPREIWRPVLKINQPATTLWFHPHPHHDTARQIYMGLTGLIILDDGSDARLNLPRTYGVDDLPIILQDRSFDSEGSIGYDNKELNALDIAYGARGDSVIVNGAIAPIAKVPASLVRLRLLNAANAQNFDLRFKDRRTFYVIASDGGFLPAPVAVTQLTISPAERFEILVDFTDGKAVALETGPDKEMGEFGRVAPDGSADYVPVMQFEPTQTRSLVKRVPDRLIEPAAVTLGSAVRRRQFVLDSGLCAGRQQSWFAQGHARSDRDKRQSF
jgi:Multicopper oxidase